MMMMMIINMLLGRPVVKFTMIQREGSDINISAAADFVATLAKNGSLQQLMPSLTVAHAAAALGNWSCWFNWDSPDTTVPAY